MFVHVLLLAFLLPDVSAGRGRGYACSVTNANAGRCAGLVKLNMDAGLGRCLPQGSLSDERATRFLANNRIYPKLGFNPRERTCSSNLRPLTDTSDPRLQALTRVMLAFDNIGGGLGELFSGGNEIRVVFGDETSAARNSRRVGPRERQGLRGCGDGMIDEIQLSGGQQNMTGTGHSSLCQGTDNIGLIAHELGHMVGGANNGEHYNAYVRTMGSSRCNLTGYGTSGDYPVEPFAEVLAAYVTMPQLFQGKGPGCEKAFRFMQTLFNEPNMTMSCEARRSSYRVRPGRYRNNGPRQNQRRRPSSFIGV